MTDTTKEAFIERWRIAIMSAEEGRNIPELLEVYCEAAIEYKDRKEELGMTAQDLEFIMFGTRGVIV